MIIMDPKFVYPSTTKERTRTMQATDNLWKITTKKGKRKRAMTSVRRTDTTCENGV